MRPSTLRIVGVCLSFALLSTLAAAPAAAQTGEERFLVELDAEGDADVSMTFTYDLDTEDEEAAFEELRANETARTALADRFGSRMTAVAADASTATDREMSVTDPSTEFRRDGGVGVIELSVSWSNLAAVDGDRLTVTEPFASGFEPDRPFTVVAPEGYGVASAEPSPSSTDETSATWDPGTGLDGFEVVLEPTAGDETDDGSDDRTADDDTAEDSPGFGVVVAVLALVAAAFLAGRRR